MASSTVSQKALARRLDELGLDRKSNRAKQSVGSVVRQRDGATVSPVAWVQGRSISDDVEMTASRPGEVKWVGVDLLEASRRDGSDASDPAPRDQPYWPSAELCTKGEARAATRVRAQQEDDDI